MRDHDTASTWGANLTWGTLALTQAGRSSPSHDALILLAHVVMAAPGIIEQQHEHPIDAEDAARFRDWVRRRGAGEPMEYLTGHMSFMGLDLIIDRRVALVDPGTQWLVEIALECLRFRAAEQIVAVDIGTGCGAIALALLSLEPRITYCYGVDASAAALAVAHENARRHWLDGHVTWLEGDLLDPLPEMVDLIIAHIPPHADDDPEPLRRFIAQVPTKLSPGGILAFTLETVHLHTATALLAEVLPTAIRYSEPLSEQGERCIIAQLP